MKRDNVSTSGPRSLRSVSGPGAVFTVTVVGFSSSGFGSALASVRLFLFFSFSSFFSSCFPLVCEEIPALWDPLTESVHMAACSQSPARKEPQPSPAPPLPASPCTARSQRAALCEKQSHSFGYVYIFNASAAGSCRASPNRASDPPLLLLNDRTCPLQRDTACFKASSEWRLADANWPHRSFHLRFEPPQTLNSRENTPAWRNPSRAAVMYFCVSLANMISLSVSTPRCEPPTSGPFYNPGQV